MVCYVLYCVLCVSCTVCTECYVCVLYFVQYCVLYYVICYMFLCCVLCMYPLLYVLCISCTVFCVSCAVCVHGAISCSPKPLSLRVQFLCLRHCWPVALQCRDSGYFVVSFLFHRSPGSFTPSSSSSPGPKSASLNFDASSRAPSSG